MSEISVTSASSQDLYKFWQDKQNEKQAKDAELVTKQSELTKANNDVTLKTEAQTQAEARVSDAGQNVTVLTGYYNSVSQQWKFANNLLSSLASRLSNSEDNQGLQSQYDSARANLQKIEEKLKETETKLKTAKKEQEEAQKALEQAKEELADANVLQKDTETAVEKLKAEIQQLDEEVQNAQNEYEAAKIKETAEAEAASGKTQLMEEEALKEGYTIIKTVEDLKAIEKNPSGKYILMNDIDLSGVDWVPLCQGVAEDGSDIFRGILNGNGYSIINLNINVDEGTKTENVGFFGVTEDAVISDINFENAQVNTPESYNKGSVGIIAGTARGTDFNNVNVSGTLTGHQKVGGLAGTVSDFATYDEEGNTVLDNSSFNNVVSNVDINSSYYAGGLAGYVESTYSNDIVIENCSASGNINVNEKSAGGFIGEAGSTIITINNSTSSVNLSSPNAEDPRVGGFIGCANGTKIALCNSEYNGNIDAQGDFKGEYYGYYMNDAHVTIFEVSAGLPVDDILNIDGVDGLTPVVDPETGEAHYEVSVSTLNGLDKIVALIRNNPQLADVITFKVLFDFETLDAEYDPSIYAQYGIVQHIYEETDENGNTTVVNDVYIDNETDLETTYHYQNFYTPTTEPIIIQDYEKTLIDGLWKDRSGNYYVERNGKFIQTTLEFFFENQRTSMRTRLDNDELKFRDRITSMVYYYQYQMYSVLNQQYGFPLDYKPPKIDEPEYNYLKQRQENGEELTKEEYLAIAVYELDYQIINLVAETTHNKGCGMGGDASFLEETTAVPLLDEDGRVRYTTLSGIELRQRVDEEGNLMFDEDGEPLYENLDGSEYIGLEDVYVKRGYPKTDENGNMLYTDEEGKTLTKTIDENGNETYTYEDGSAFEGDTESLTQQLDEYDLGGEYKDLENEMKDLLAETKGEKTAETTDNADIAAIADVSGDIAEQELKLKEEGEDIIE